MHNALRLLAFAGFVIAAALAAEVPAHVALVEIVGVHPDAAAKYQPNVRGTFRCASGAEIAFARINDDYCDCVASGDDEPGTSACAALAPVAQFACGTADREADSIPSTRVDDGVCDCCDGSDEPGRKCALRCARGVAARGWALVSLGESLTADLSKPKMTTAVAASGAMANFTGAAAAAGAAAAVAGLPDGNRAVPVVGQAVGGQARALSPRGPARAKLVAPVVVPLLALAAFIAWRVRVAQHKTRVD